MSMNGDQMDALEDAIDALLRNEPEAASTALTNLSKDQMLGLHTVLHQIQMLLVDGIMAERV